MGLLDLNHDVLTEIFSHTTRSDVLSLLLTTRELIGSVSAYLLAHVTLSSPAQLASFCAFVFADLPGRAHRLRSLVLGSMGHFIEPSHTRGGYYLHTPHQFDAPALATVLEHAHGLTSVALHESEHVLLIEPRLGTALLAAPLLRQVSLYGASCRARALVERLQNLHKMTFSSAAHQETLAHLPAEYRSRYVGLDANLKKDQLIFTCFYNPYSDRDTPAISTALSASRSTLTALRLTSDAWRVGAAATSSENDSGAEHTICVYPRVRALALQDCNSDYTSLAHSFPSLRTLTMYRTSPYRPHASREPEYSPVASLSQHWESLDHVRADFSSLSDLAISCPIRRLELGEAGLSTGLTPATLFRFSHWATVRNSSVLLDVLRRTTPTVLVLLTPWDQSSEPDFFTRMVEACPDMKTLCLPLPCCHSIGTAGTSWMDTSASSLGRLSLTAFLIRLESYSAGREDALLGLAKWVAGLMGSLKHVIFTVNEPEDGTLRIAAEEYEEIVACWEVLPVEDGDSEASKADGVAVRRLEGDAAWRALRDAMDAGLST